jgi:predicted transcriptional regulator
MNHDVRMEWESYDGIRTGRMFAYCFTCGRRVASLFTRETVQREDTLRALTTQREALSHRLAHVREREAYVLARREAGERNIDIAADLGLTPQRVSMIIIRARRRAS